MNLVVSFMFLHSSSLDSSTKSTSLKSDFKVSALLVKMPCGFECQMRLSLLLVLGTSEKQYMSLHRKTRYKSQISKNDLTNLWGSIINIALIAENRLILYKNFIILLYFRNFMFNYLGVDLLWMFSDFRSYHHCQSWCNFNLFQNRFLRIIPHFSMHYHICLTDIKVCCLFLTFRLNVCNLCCLLSRLKMSWLYGWDRWTLNSNN